MIADPVTTITLTAGTPQSVKFASSYPFYWIDNKTSGNVYARIGGTPVPDSDGTFTIAAGSQLRVSGGAFDNDITLLGVGKVQIIASEIASCPFKLGSKGGGNEISGAPSYSVDAVDYPLLGLNIFGKSAQDGTPTPDAPVDIVSVGDSGSVEINTYGGNNLFDPNKVYKSNYSQISNGEYDPDEKYNVYSVEVKENTEYKLIFNSNINYQGNYRVHAVDNNDNWISQLSYVYVSAPGEYTIKFITVTNKIHISINNSSTDIRLMESKTASITSSLPLCGIPVSEGGNYTDSNGQQWICDELIYNADGTGKIIKRTARIDSYNGETISGAYISTTGSLTTGATVIHQLNTPQKIELTAAEISALKVLQTFDGVTNFSNSADAEMSVKYCTNKAFSEFVLPITKGLQAQIDELKSAVLSLGGNV